MSKMSKTIAILGVVAGLGVAALPLSSYALDPVNQDTTVKLKISDKLSLTVDGKNDNSAEVTLTSSATGTQAGLYSANPVTVNVISNNTKGYGLTIVGSTTGDNITEGTKPSPVVVTSMYNQYGDAIPAGTLATGASSWGYYVGEAPSEGTDPTWLAIPDTATSILGTGEGSAATVEAGEDYKVHFGAMIKDGQAAGDYEGKVTFTVTNK